MGQVQYSKGSCNSKSKMIVYANHEYLIASQLWFTQVSYLQLQVTTEVPVLIGNNIKSIKGDY